MLPVPYRFRLWKSAIRFARRLLPDDLKQMIFLLCGFALTESYSSAWWSAGSLNAIRTSGSLDAIQNLARVSVLTLLPLLAAGSVAYACCFWWRPRKLRQTWELLVVGGGILGLVLYLGFATAVLLRSPARSY